MKADPMPPNNKSPDATKSARAPDKRGQDIAEAELEPHQLDVQTPMTDDDLAQALEDTFPASDPINFAGSITGIPAETPSAAPIGTHPLAGSTEERDDAASEAGPTGADKTDDPPRKDRRSRTT